VNEYDLTTSLGETHDADYLYRNPRKALDTIAHFSQLWHEFLGGKGEAKIDADQARLLTEFVLAKDWDTKADFMRLSGIAGVDEALSLGNSEQRKAADEFQRQCTAARLGACPLAKN
jgi:hypothetical protein